MRSGADLAEELPADLLGGAWSADSGASSTSSTTRPTGPTRSGGTRSAPRPTDDVLVLSEPDERFELNVRATRSGGLVVLWSASRDTSEVWVLDARDPTPTPRSVGGRRRGVEYDVEHAVPPDGSDVLLLVTNDGATEFRLARCPVPRDGDQDHAAWAPVRDEDPAERLERVDAFAGHVVLSLRSPGEHRLRVLPLDALDGRRAIDIRPPFAAGTVALGHNQEFTAGAVTVVDQSYSQPPVWSDVDLATGGAPSGTGRRRLGHDPDRYVGETRTFPVPTAPRCR